MSEDINFLRNQVERLNSVLATYQSKYPPVALPSIDLESDGVPWLTDRTLMSPLLADYDSNLSSLKAQVEHYEREQKELRSQTDKLIAENKQMRRQLQETVQTQLEDISTDLDAAVGVDLGDEQLLKNLQAQLQASIEEKDAVTEMWHASSREIERLEAHLSTSHTNPRVAVMESQARQMKDEYSKQISDLQRELEILNHELGLKKNEAQASAIQVNELRSTLEDVKSQLRIQESQKSHVVGSMRKSENMAGDLHKRNIELESVLDEAERKVAILKREKEELQNRVMEMRNESTNHEKKAYDAALQVRDSVQMVENAMIDKDQAVLKAKQAEEEVTRLTSALNKVIDEAGAKTREEVDNIRQQCNQNISRLMDEIHKLEIENTEKHAQLERAVREKRLAEDQIDRMNEQNLINTTKDSISTNDLTHRACDAEQKRDEALVKLDALEQYNKRLEMTYKAENGHLKAKLGQLSDQFEHLKQEYQLSTEERVGLLEKIEEYKRKVQQLQEERDASIRSKTKELSTMEQDLKRKERDYEIKLQTLEDSHRRTFAELRQMLASQQRMSEKWKAECDNITRKFESKMADMRGDLNREKKRCSELSKLLKESTEKTAQTQAMLSDYSKNIKVMEKRMKDTELRNSPLYGGVHTAHVPRDSRDILQERRMLQKELERSLRDSKGSGVPEPLGLADLKNDGT